MGCKTLTLLFHQTVAEIRSTNPVPVAEEVAQGRESTAWNRQMHILADCSYWTNLKILREFQFQPLFCSRQQKVASPAWSTNQNSSCADMMNFRTFALPMGNGLPRGTTRRKKEQMNVRI